jgi:hypothetical protein
VAWASREARPGGPHRGFPSGCKSIDSAAGPTMTTLEPDQPAAQP